MTLFFNMNNYFNLSGKTEKNISVQCSALPFYFGTGHVTVLSAPPWKSTPTYASTGVPAHLISVLPVQSETSKENS